MITVCDGGWTETALHARIVLADDGKKDDRISHGMCPGCRSKVAAEMDGTAPRLRTEYETYLANPNYDPRD